MEASKLIKANVPVASTSSVYGDSNKFPLKETQDTSKPLTLYAASKKTNEVLAYSYSNIYSCQLQL